LQNVREGEITEPNSPDFVEILAGSASSKMWVRGR